jgi:hypothetical protein
MNIPKQETIEQFAANIAEALGKGMTIDEVSQIGLTSIYYPVWMETLNKNIVPSVEDIINYFININRDKQNLIESSEKDTLMEIFKKTKMTNHFIDEYSEITQIKIDIWVKYGIRLYTGITDVYGHNQFFECIAYKFNDGEIVFLSNTGENPINISEVETLKEAKDYIIKNYSPLKFPMINFS